jgi:hypothetical protein
VPLAKRHGIFFVAQYQLCRLCLEGSQSASIYKASKSSTSKALIFLLATAVGADIVMRERRHCPC